MKKIIPDLRSRLRFPDYIEMQPLREKLKILPIELLRSSLKRVLKEMRADSFIIVDKDASDILINYQYPGNYREMEGILRRAMKLTINNNRNEILSEDTKLMISKT